MPVINDGKGNAKMFDKALIEKLGIKAKAKYFNDNSALIVPTHVKKDEIIRALRIIDEQDAINRYKWYNIAAELTSNEVERLLYFKGDLIFFYLAETDTFYLTPYALDGGIDFYGRYNYVHPLPMASGEDDKPISGSDSEDVKKRKIAYQTQLQLLSQLRLKVIKKVVQPEEITKELLTGSAVIIRDYTNQIGQNNIARSILNDPIVRMMGDYFPFLSTNLLMGTGITSMKVKDSTEKDEVKAAARSVYQSAIEMNPYVAMTGNIDFQELTGGARNKAEDYLMAFQSLDNFRLSTLGISNGGVFEKKSHILESENAVNYSTVLSAFQDGLKTRQEACNIINSIWGLDMWVEPSEASLGADTDGDGQAMDRGESQPPVEGANQEEGGVE